MRILETSCGAVAIGLCMLFQAGCGGAASDPEAGGGTAVSGAHVTDGTADAGAGECLGPFAGEMEALQSSGRGGFNLAHSGDALGWARWEGVSSAVRWPNGWTAAPAPEWLAKLGAPTFTFVRIFQANLRLEESRTCVLQAGDPSVPANPSCVANIETEAGHSEHSYFLRARSGTLSIESVSERSLRAVIRDAVFEGRAYRNNRITEIPCVRVREMRIYGGIYTHIR